MSIPKGHKYLCNCPVCKSHRKRQDRPVKATPNHPQWLPQGAMDQLRDEVNKLKALVMSRDEATNQRFKTLTLMVQEQGREWHTKNKALLERVTALETPAPETPAPDVPKPSDTVAYWVRVLRGMAVPYGVNKQFWLQVLERIESADLEAPETPECEGCKAAVKVMDELEARADATVPATVWVAWQQSGNEQRINFVAATHEDARRLAPGASGIVEFIVRGTPSPPKSGPSEGCNCTICDKRRQDTAGEEKDKCEGNPFYCSCIQHQDAREAMGLRRITTTPEEILEEVGIVLDLQCTRLCQARNDVAMRQGTYQEGTRLMAEIFDARDKVDALALEIFKLAKK